MLESLTGTAESKLNKIDNHLLIIYDYRIAKFGVVQKKRNVQNVIKSWQQVEELRLLKKSEEEREGIELQKNE